MTDAELGINPCQLCGQSLEFDSFNYFEEDWPCLCDGIYRQCPDKIAWEKRLDQYIAEEIAAKKAE